MATSPYELTEEETELLQKHLEFYQSLESGRRTPKTEAQKHFVAVCQGRARAETPHEMAYAKYMRLRAAERRRELSAHDDRGIPEYEEGYPRPGWFTDEDWKKLKSRDYAELQLRNRDW
ncbi:MAG: DUF413 domain-containing protein [Candidatus Rokubacteria bacterium]|nr:DUF413 domain-containing protein [Candidatus Rokubacteria bacterium]